MLIHPAAALAALVWSIYLMSDDLVAAAPMTHSGELENPEKPDFTNWPTDAHEISNDLDVLPKVAQKRYRSCLTQYWQNTLQTLLQIAMPSG